MNSTVQHDYKLNDAMAHSLLMHPQPWRAPADLRRKMSEGKNSGADFLLVDLRRTDHEVSKHTLPDTENVNGLHTILVLKPAIAHHSSTDGPSN